MQVCPAIATTKVLKNVRFQSAILAQARRVELVKRMDVRVGTGTLTIESSLGQEETAGVKNPLPDRGWRLQ